MSREWRQAERCGIRSAPGVAVALFLAALMPGCSWIFVQPPPPNDAGDLDCTSSAVAPVIDTVFATTNVISALYVSGHHDPMQNTGAAVGLGLAVAGLWTASAIYGYTNTSMCRDAKAEAIGESYRPHPSRRTAPPPYPTAATSVPPPFPPAAHAAPGSGSAPPPYPAPSPAPYPSGGEVAAPAAPAAPAPAVNPPVVPPVPAAPAVPQQMDDDEPPTGRRTGATALPR